MRIYQVPQTRVDMANGGCFVTSLAPERVAIEAGYVAHLWRAGFKVQAIRHIREVLGVGLSDAKGFCEDAVKVGVNV